MLPEHSAPDDAQTQALTDLIRDFAARPSQRFYARQAAAPWNSQGESLKPRPIRRLVLVPALLILALGLMGMSPGLRALAADFLGITRAPTDTLTHQASRQIVHGPEPRPIAEVQAETPYPIYAPATMPDDYRLAGASYNAHLGNGVHLVGVHLTYPSLADPAVELSVGQMSLDEVCEQCPDVGASAIVETVDLNGRSGAYVRGAWSGSAEHQSDWDPNYDLHAVTWQQDGYSFRVSGPLAVSKDDLLTVARSMRPAP